MLLFLSGAAVLCSANTTLLGTNFSTLNYFTGQLKVHFTPQTEGMRQETSLHEDNNKKRFFQILATESEPRLSRWHSQVTNYEQDTNLNEGYEIKLESTLIGKGVVSVGLMRDGTWATQDTVSEPLLGLKIVNTNDTFAEVEYQDSQEKTWRARISLRDLDLQAPHIYSVTWNPAAGTFSFKVDKDLWLENANVIDHFS